MSVFFCIVLGLMCVGEAAGWFLCWLDKEHWVRKYLEAKEQLDPPFVWDYTKETGWME